MERDTREQIIQTVKELYREFDMDHITTAMIIRVAGISKGALYWHFPSKEGHF